VLRNPKYSLLISFFLGLLTIPPLTCPAGASEFSMNAYSFMDDDRRSSMKVSINIPNGSLVFLKKDGLFESSFELYIKILDRNDRVIETAVLNKNVVVGSYSETRSNKGVSKLSRVFPLGPGSYKVESTVRVRETHLIYRKMATVTVPNFLATGIGLSIPRLFATGIDTVQGSFMRRAGVTDGEEMEEKEGTSFAHFNKQPALRFAVYTENMTGNSIPCEMVYEVVDQGRNQLFYGKKRVTLNGEDDEFTVSFNVDDWEPGSYSFNLKAWIDQPRREATTTLRFTIEFGRAMLRKHFGETLEILSLIADKEELQPLSEAPVADRPRIWMEFWSSRDPTPGTAANEALEEHLRRVRYVKDQFATVEHGWKTDRGKVYIRYGQPDEVDVQIDPYYQGEYQTWRYFEKNLTFVFYDRFGLGDYRLVSTRAF
jgi:GWxTD domain-containing protein